MFDDLDFETVPIDEKIESLGPNYDAVRARAQARHLIDLLVKKFGEPPYGAKLKIKSNPHDFGDYLSVTCRFDDSISEALDYCLCIESNFPLTWKDDGKIDCVDWKVNRDANRD